MRGIEHVDDPSFIVLTETKLFFFLFAGENSMRGFQLSYLL